MGAYGVDIFFVISGFVVCLMLDKLKTLYHPVKKFKLRFILSRFIRVILPLWIAILLQYIVVGNYSGTSNLINSIFLIPSENYYYNNLIVYYLEPQWSLVFELIFYIILTLFISSRTFLYSAIALFIICFPAFVGFNSYISNPIMLEFIFGMISYQVYLNRKLSESYFEIKKLSLSIIVFLVFGFLLKNQAGEINSILRVLTVGVSCFFIITICSKNKSLNYKLAKNRALIFMGDISYSLYLTHMVGFRIFTNYFDTNDLLILFCLMLFITVAFYIFVDKPCHIFAKMILKYD